ncbi:hypothetical protein F0U60_53920 [Archangium minus]|uniref:CMP/dCMP-type deaminase domain-containing protein n=1 Tax=Archangium minus TaxID=83450 RepID=A0ABY9XCL9_9BACT|nr:hypothetical protein F0U60_53920 [Archangium minus]
MYASTVPCAMCTGAIFWGGVRRVAFALFSGLGVPRGAETRGAC